MHSAQKRSKKKAIEPTGIMKEELFDVDLSTLKNIVGQKKQSKLFDNVQAKKRKLYERALQVDEVQEYQQIPDTENTKDYQGSRGYQFPKSPKRRKGHSLTGVNKLSVPYIRSLEKKLKDKQDQARYYLAQTTQLENKIATLKEIEKRSWEVVNSSLELSADPNDTFGVSQSDNDDTLEPGQVEIFSRALNLNKSEIILLDKWIKKTNSKKVHEKIVDALSVYLNLSNNKPKGGSSYTKEADNLTNVGFLNNFSNNLSEALSKEKGVSTLYHTLGLQRHLMNDVQYSHIQEQLAQIKSWNDLSQGESKDIIISNNDNHTLEEAEEVVSLATRHNIIVQVANHIYEDLKRKEIFTPRNNATSFKASTTEAGIVKPKRLPPLTSSKQTNSLQDELKQSNFRHEFNKLLIKKDIEQISTVYKWADGPGRTIAIKIGIERLVKAFEHHCTENCSNYFRHWKLYTKLNRYQQDAANYMKLKAGRKACLTIASLRNRQKRIAFDKLANNLFKQRQEEQTSSAIEIQRIIRGYVGKCRRYNKKVSIAATRIQALQRGQAIRRALYNVRKEWHNTLIRQEKEKVIYLQSVLKIQRAIRGFLTRKRVRDTVLKVKSLKAALVLQRTFRMILARMERNRRQEWKYYIECICKIQHAWICSLNRRRGYRLRKQIEMEVQRKAEEDRLREEKLRLIKEQEAELKKQREAERAARLLREMEESDTEEEEYVEEVPKKKKSRKKKEQEEDEDEEIEDTPKIRKPLDLSQLKTYEDLADALGSDYWSPLQSLHDFSKFTSTIFLVQKFIKGWKVRHDMLHKKAKIIAERLLSGELIVNLKTGEIVFSEQFLKDQADLHGFNLKSKLEEDGLHNAFKHFLSEDDKDLLRKMEKSDPLLSWMPNNNEMIEVEEIQYVEVMDENGEPMRDENGEIVKKEVIVTVKKPKDPTASLSSILGSSKSLESKQFQALKHQYETIMYLKYGKAILKIQSIVRVKVARMRAEKRRQEIENARLAKHLRCIIRIQSLARKRFAMKIVDEKLAVIEREKAVLTLQCAVRMMLAVCKLRRLQDDHRQGENLKFIRDQSARLIQRVYRGYRVRFEYYYDIQYIKRRLAEKLMNKDLRAAITIQCAYRTYLAKGIYYRLLKEYRARKEREEQEVEIESQMDANHKKLEKETKAIMIQCGIRKFMAIRKVEKLRSDKRNREAVIEEQKRLKAALRLQALARGNKGREYVKRNRKALEFDREERKYCVECTGTRRNRASKLCKVCLDRYCDKCWKVFHAHGNKRNHTYKSLDDDDSYEIYKKKEPEWIEYWDESAQASYYYNVKTGEASWVPPEGVEIKGA